MKREIDPLREVLLKRLKTEHLRETPVKDMWDLSKWAEKMRTKSFYYNQFYEGMAKWNRMGVQDQETFARLTAQFPNAEWEEVARVPYEVNELLWKLHPDLFEDTEKTESWLASEAGAPYRVPLAARRPFSFNSRFAVGGKK